MPTIEQTKKQLSKWPDDSPCAFALWLPGDVQQVAQEVYGHEVSDEVAEAVLAEVHHRHDATIGITWDHIRWALDDYVEEECSAAKD